MEYKLRDIHWAYGDDGKLQMYIQNSEGNAFKNLLTDFVANTRDLFYAYRYEFGEDPISRFDSLNATYMYAYIFEKIFANELKEYEEVNKTAQEKYSKIARKANKHLTERSLLREKFGKINKYHEQLETASIERDIQIRDIHSLIDITIDEDRLFKIYSSIQERVENEIAIRKSNPKYF